MDSVVGEGLVDSHNGCWKLCISPGDLSKELSELFSTGLLVVYCGNIKFNVGSIFWESKLLMSSWGMFFSSMYLNNQWIYTVTFHNVCLLLTRGIHQTTNKATTIINDSTVHVLVNGLLHMYGMSFSSIKVQF